MIEKKFILEYINKNNNNISGEVFKILQEYISNISIIIIYQMPKILNDLIQIKILFIAYYGKTKNLLFVFPLVLCTF